MKPDCRTCGLCCVAPHGQEIFCNVEEDDVERLGREAKKQVVYPTPFETVLALVDGKYIHGALRTKEHVSRVGQMKDIETTTCVFLRGSLLHRVSCRIYENRPKVCRSVVRPGDRWCLARRNGIMEALKDEDGSVG